MLKLIDYKCPRCGHVTRVGQYIGEINNTHECGNKQCGRLAVIDPHVLERLLEERMQEAA